jgi:hypothetical protein
MAIALLPSMLSYAQTTGQGVISGTITDASEAVVAGARITITNLATGVVRTAVTNGTGYYQVNALNAGEYRIAVVQTGFQEAVREGITLETNARLNVSIQLVTGQIVEQVTVTAEAPLLNTESGSAGQVLTTKQLESLPAAGVNPMWLTAMAPGVSAPQGQSASRDGTLNWNGVSNWGVNGVTQRNEYSLDGAPNMQNRANAINPSEDEMGEMNIDTTGFDASVGHSIGAVVTMTTKSGTNALHGSVRESFQNTPWTAMGHFQGDNYKNQLRINGCNGDNMDNPDCKAVRNRYGWPRVHEHNFSVAVGGPVYIPKVIDGRNKLFFFQSILTDPYTQNGSASAHVPTVLERSGNFTDLIDPTHPTPPPEFAQANPGTTYYGRYQIYDPFSVRMVNGVPRRDPIPGNIIPASLMANNKMASFYNSLLPTPTSNDPTVNNYAYTYSAPSTYHDYTTRVDYTPNENNVIYARYTRTSYTKTMDGWTTTGVDTQDGPRWIDVPAVGWNRVINPTTNLDVNFGGSNYKTLCCYYLHDDEYKPSTAGLPAYLDEYAGKAQSIPIINIGGLSGIGQQDCPWCENFRTLSLRANLSNIRGKHAIRLGGEFRSQNHKSLNNRQGAPLGTPQGTYTFNNTYTQQNNGTDSRYTQDALGLSYAAFLMGVQSSSAVTKASEWSLSSPYFGMYIGDTWHVTPKLTIIPGLRFEYEYGVTEADNRQLVGWDPNVSLPIASGVNAAYSSLYDTFTAEQKAVMPTSLSIRGGPIYAGVNGASRREAENNWRLMPRLAVAYRLTRNTVIRGGYGRFYDTLNALVPNLMQPGYSVTTSVDSSTNFGQNFDINNRPLTNPFPEVNGNRFNTPLGNSLGGLYYLGGGNPGGLYDHVVPPRQDRVSVTLQRQIGSSMMVEATYVGAWTRKLIIGQPQAPLPASLYKGGQQPNATMNKLLSTQVANPFRISNFSDIQASNPALYSLMSKNNFFTAATQSLGAIMRPYAWMGTFNLNRSIGATNFHQLQLNVTRKWKSGLTFMSALQFNDQHDRDWFQNDYDAAPSWEPSNGSKPWRYTAQVVWDLPFGRGRWLAKSGPLSWIFGGFQLSFTYELEPGQLIEFGNLFYIGDPKDLLLDKPIYNNQLAAGGPNYVQWLTAGNVVATPTYDSQGVVISCSYSGTGLVTNPSCQSTYNSRIFPRRVDGVRTMMRNNMNANMQRNFRIMEKLTFETRFETYNTLNHHCLGGPNTGATNANFGRITGDGWPNSGSRWITLMGRLRF